MALQTYDETIRKQNAHKQEQLDELKEMATVDVAKSISKLFKKYDEYYTELSYNDFAKAILNELYKYTKENVWTI